MLTHKTKIFAGICAIITAALAGLAWAVVDVPQNVELSADMDSITVTWDRDADADGYFVYWGTEFENLDQRGDVPDTAGETFVIRNLDPGTVYYVAVSAHNNDVESRRSTVQFIETSADTTPPGVPQGLRVADLEQITEASIPFQWDADTTSELDFYRIDYRNASDTSSGSEEVDAQADPRVTISGLESGVRYFFTITAVDDSGNESDASYELAADTLPDQLPPFSPEKIEAQLSDVKEIMVRIVESNSNMADLAGHRIYYGRQPDAYEGSVDIGESLSQPFSGLSENTVWYFAASAYDHAGNESPLSDPVSAKTNETRGFLDSSEDFDGGCFISSLFGPGKSAYPEKKNKTGVSAGWLVPAESEFEDFYGNDIFPVFAFYDRLLGDHVSISARAGYMEESGYRQTVSGQSTGLKTTFWAVPVSASINWNFPVASNITGFVGAGPDYWYFSEEPEGSLGSDINEWVGGYHGRTGLWLSNRDPDFESWGALLECSYFQIDGFGGNSVNPGGWLFSLGFFYGF